MTESLEFPLPSYAPQKHSDSALVTYLLWILVLSYLSVQKKVCCGALPPQRRRNFAGLQQHLTHIKPSVLCAAFTFEGVQRYIIFKQNGGACSVSTACIAQQDISLPLTSLR